LSTREIQQQVLDPDSVLLEYSLGDERSYLWTVTPSSIQSFELPPRKTIETATRRVYELLTERNKQITFEKPAQQSARISQADGDYVSASTALSQMLLGPVISQLEKKRLLIVADGALNYLPFAALPNPAGDSALIMEHEIVSLPSASTLAVLRQERSGRAPAPKTLAVIADPVFEKTDARLMRSRAGTRHTTANDRSVFDIGDNGLNRFDGWSATRQSESDEVVEIHRLPFTRREADQIAALVPAANRLEALDFDANRTIATSPKLGQYRYVHFATHGFLNSAHPELSGIVLSLVNRQGSEQDGFLWAHEVYNL